MEESMDAPQPAQSAPRAAEATAGPQKSQRRTGRAAVYIIVALVLIAALYVGVSSLYRGATTTTSTTVPTSVSPTTIVSSNFSNQVVLSSCHVVREPFPQLVGSCSNNSPTYVGLITNKTIASFSGLYNTTPSTTTTVWLYLKKQFYASSNNGSYGSYNLNLTANMWYLLTVAMGSNMNGTINTTVYLNGNTIYTGSPAVLYALLNFSISAQYYQYVSNFQYYNITLGQAQVSGLYNESIGGLPVNLTHLTGWFPLNNNTYDYSGLGARFSYSNLSFTDSYPSP